MACQDLPTWSCEKGGKRHGRNVKRRQRTPVTPATFPVIVDLDPGIFLTAAGYLLNLGENGYNVRVRGGLDPRARVLHVVLLVDISRHFYLLLTFFCYILDLAHFAFDILHLAFGILRSSPSAITRARDHDATRSTSSLPPSLPRTRLALTWSTPGAWQTG